MNAPLLPSTGSVERKDAFLDQSSDSALPLETGSTTKDFASVLAGKSENPKCPPEPEADSESEPSARVAPHQEKKSRKDESESSEFIPPGLWMAALHNPNIPDPPQPASAPDDSSDTADNVAGEPVTTEKPGGKGVFPWAERFNAALTALSSTLETAASDAAAAASDVACESNSAEAEEEKPESGKSDSTASQAVPADAGADPSIPDKTPSAHASATARAVTNVPSWLRATTARSANESADRPERTFHESGKPTEATGSLPGRERSVPAAASQPDPILPEPAVRQENASAHAASKGTARQEGETSAAIDFEPAESDSAEGADNASSSSQERSSDGEASKSGPGNTARELRLERPIPAPPASHGMNHAKRENSMKAAAQMSKTAPETEQKLPVSESASASSSKEIAMSKPLQMERSANRDEASEHIPVSFPDEVDRPEDVPMGPREPAQELSPLARRVAHSISREVVFLKQYDFNTLSVVIRPDTHTELSLHLVSRPDGVEAFAVCKRGDIENLSSQWTQLQQSLSQQGIKLAPLTESLPAAQNGGSATFDFHQHKQNPQKQDFQPPTPMDFHPAMKKAAPSNPQSGLTPTQKLSAHALETWA